MKRTWLSLLAVLLTALSSFAAEADLGLPIGVPFDVPLQIVGGKTLPGQALILPGTSAEKSMLVWYVGADGKLARLNYGVTRKDGPNPIPPKPDPIPVPVKKAAWLYIIHESKDDTPAQAATWNSKVLHDASVSSGVTLAVYDQDIAVKHFPNATKQAVAKGLPAAVFLTKEGAVVGVESLVATDAMVALVKKYGGGK